MNASWTRLICGMVLLPILACQQDRYQARPIGFVVGDTTLCAPPTTQNRRYTEADLRAAPRFRLDSAGQLTIGDREGGEEYDLSRVRRITMASPTVALLSTSAPASVLWADASTDEIHVVASGGEGPGQVRDVGGIVVRGTDSIGIFDPINARISWFGSNRRLLGSTSLLSPTGVPLLFSTAVALAGMLPGSRLAVSDVQILSGSRGGGNAERWRSMARLDVVTLVEGPSIAAVSRSLQLPNHDMAMHSLSTPDGAVRSPFPVRFSRSAFAGVVGKRLVLSAPEGDGFVFCGGEEGASTAIQLMLRPRQTEPRMIDVAVTAESLQAGRPSRETRLDKAALHAWIKARPFATTLPLFYQAIATGEVLWVIEAHAPTDPTWSAIALGADGALLGRLADQPGTPPFTMTERLAVFRDTAEDGTVSFRVVPIQRP